MGAGSGLHFFTLEMFWGAAQLNSTVRTVVYEWAEMARDGGLMAYGESLGALYRRVGDYAGRVLNGANPAELPLDQPAAIGLVINLKTAQALGLTIPQAILARADEVIE